MRLRSLGARVVPHVAEELGRLDSAARGALLDVLRDVETADAKALRRRLVRANAPTPAQSARPESPADAVGSAGPESQALQALRALPPPRRDERASVSRERGEAHLALARIGARLARKDLLLCLDTLGAERARLYCEAAGLIGDGDFLPSLARVAQVRPEAAKAIALIASRERLTLRSKVLRNLEEPLRLIVARSIAGH